MKLKLTFAAAALGALALPVHAGDFTSLLYGTGPGPDGIWGNGDDTDAVTAGPSGPRTIKVLGVNNPAGDKLFLATDSVETMVGNSSIPTVIDYSATEWRTSAQGGTVPRGIPVASGSLSLLDYRVTTNLALGADLIGDAYDFVFRDSRDNTLVFGTRFVLGQESNYSDDAELNFMYRYGFVEGDTVFSTDVAWLSFTDFDLRLYNASRSNTKSLISSTPDLDLNAVAFQADVNLSEGNAFSGIYLIKTDATDWKLMDNAIGYYQAGEEGQPLLFSSIAGFAPTVPVPEPETYALFLAGLGLIGAAARRRSRR